MVHKDRLFHTLSVAMIIMALVLAACSAPAPTALPATEIPMPTVSPDMAAQLRPILVEDVRVEIGVGSPIPVNVMVSGSWPDLCAQLARIEQNIYGTLIEISLLATPADPGCPPDYLGLPFGIALPLNMVEMPLGDYSITVNGVTASFDWNGQSPAAPVEAQPTPTGVPAGPLAYIGSDNNVWLLDRGTGESRQVTQDATPVGLSGDNQIISHSSPLFSSDGVLLAYEKETGNPVPSGYEFHYDLWAYDVATGQSRPIVEDLWTTGFAWKPGTHLLAYTLSVNPNYFTRRGAQPKADLASGVFGLNVDSGEITELVPPSRGYSLVNPIWSPDGRYVSFDEVYVMEGRGMFAYFDFETGQYVSWEEAIGAYSWSPNGAQVAYDTQTYVATGTERIWLKDLQGGEPVGFSPDFDPGYAIHPLFSPVGDQIAYLVNFGDMDNPFYHLYVQDLVGGQPRDLGEFESVYVLNWSADGMRLVFNAGPYESQQVIEVDLASGVATTLAQGREPAVP